MRITKLFKALAMGAVVALAFVGCFDLDKDLLSRTSSSFSVDVKDTEGTPLGGIYCTLRNDKISKDPLAYGEIYPYPEQDGCGEPGEMCFTFGTGTWEKDATNVYVLTDKPREELTDEDHAKLDAAYNMCDLESGTKTDYYIVINDSSTGKQNAAYETDRIVYFSDLESRDKPCTKITLKSISE